MARWHVTAQRRRHCRVRGRTTRSPASGCARETPVAPRSARPLADTACDRPTARTKACQPPRHHADKVSSRCSQKHERGGPSADSGAESFNASLTRETLQGSETWPTARQARLDTFRWASRYNTVRRHSRLGQRSPISYELLRDVPSTTVT
ncbi:integrase core domain-containing protein [Streptomyces flavofungini]|uniref:integrase core domain-containing protein n=1 Tax=Streptomyces flavofungini TaxID=68200 RepID=UPI0035563D02